MEFSKLAEEKGTELDNMHLKLNSLEKQLQGEKERFPPRWSKDVKELEKWVNELEVWIKNPQINRSKELIDILKKLASDKRSFKGLVEDYLIGVLETLENGVRLLSETSIDSLKANIAQKILNKLQEEEDIIGLVRDVKTYLKGIGDFEALETNNEFIGTVKNEELKNLSTPTDLSLEQIERAKATLKKALSAFELLSGYGIGIKAYNQTYKAVKNVDLIWQEASNMRVMLSNTEYTIIGKLEDPFGEIKEIMNRRALSLKGNTLTEISLGLSKVEEQLRKWKAEIMAFFDSEYRRTKALAEFAKIGESLGQLLEDFQRLLAESSDVNIIYKPYQKLQVTKRRAMKKLESQFSEYERRIIENMEGADKLVEIMGENFWDALKDLREKQLIQIVIERGE